MMQFPASAAGSSGKRSSGCISPGRETTGRARQCAALAACAGALLWAQPARAQRGDPAAAAWQRYVGQSHGVLSALNQNHAIALPPAPAGATDITFAEFFGPIGDRGLEYSPKLRALAGQSVRLAGFMVRESERAPGVFRLAPWPLAIETKGPCAADTAPPSAVHVILPETKGRPVAYRPGRLVLVGRLELGTRVEADGRNSVLRLILDGDLAP